MGRRRPLPCFFLVAAFWFVMRGGVVLFPSDLHGSAIMDAMMNMGLLVSKPGAKLAERRSLSALKTAKEKDPVQGEGEDTRVKLCLSASLPSSLSRTTPLVERALLSSLSRTTATSIWSSGRIRSKRRFSFGLDDMRPHHATLRAAGSPLTHARRAW